MRERMARNFAEVINDVRKMCNSHDDCTGCDLFKDHMCLLDRVLKDKLSNTDARTLINLIERQTFLWKKEHPTISLREIVKEFFPYARTEKFCPSLLIPNWTRVDRTCTFVPDKQKCERCWTKPLDEIDPELLGQIKGKMHGR